MNQENETEVLVVGAGPVGMLTALLLDEAGVQTVIIDREPRAATRSYACVLHPAALRLLDRLGLARDVLARGRRIESVGLYDGESRRAEIKLSELSGAFACAVALPQSILESVLEQRLEQKGRRQIRWNHRLAELQFDPRAVTATIDHLKQSAKGYIIREWDWTVQKRLELKAGYVVGADGHGSLVRSRLNFECEHLAGPEQFAVFECETTGDPGGEVRVVLNEGAVNVLWPLPGNCCRWTFQLVKDRSSGGFPEKERDAVRIEQEELDRNTRACVERLVHHRAPWFKTEIKDVYWWSRVEFEHCLARQFGKDRCWLAGDAAHQTGPVGVQGMNAGLNEAADLAGALTQTLRANGAPKFLEAYGATHRGRWENLLGLKGGLIARPQTDPWLKANAARILSCLPATGGDLAPLASQLGFDFSS